MVAPISFGSTYKIKLTNSQLGEFEGHKYNLLDFCEDRNIRYKTDYLYKPLRSDACFVDETSVTKCDPSKCQSGVQYTIFASDRFDSRIENICQYYNIRFEKLTSKDLLVKNAIYDRILPAPKGYTLVTIKADKLDELLKDQYDNNFSHCENDHIVYYGEKTEEILKSGECFAAPTLYITYNGANQTLQEYVDKYGVNNINPGSISFWLSQRTSDPDHCMYFEMKYAGLNDIPVYLNEASLENAKALGLV